MWEAPAKRPGIDNSQGVALKRFLSGYRAIPLIATLITLVGAFIIGTTIVSRHDPNSADAIAPPDSALAGGFDTLAAVLLVPPTLLFAAFFRYLAYARVEKAWGQRSAVTIAAWVVEVIYIALTLGILYVATEPVVDAGFALIANVSLGILWFVMSLLFLAVIVIVAKKRQPEAPVPG